MVERSEVLPKEFAFEFGNAICYSGYRHNQSPIHQSFPSYAQILEDLRILERHWQYIRIYDCSRHAELVLDVIERENIQLKVMLGAELRAELNNPGCPWGAQYSEEQLAENATANTAEIAHAASLCFRYPGIVFSVSIGNEASVDWTDHLVSVDRLVTHASYLQDTVTQPVTFCENYVPWVGKLEPLIEYLDIISLHTYPVWEYRSVGEALAYTQDNYYSVANRYPGIPVIITEAGWTTCSNGHGIDDRNANQELQDRYYRELIEWSREKQILTFVFEAFDEPWKGSSDPLEPEKHWGLFTVERKPKQVMREHFADLI